MGRSKLDTEKITVNLSRVLMEQVREYADTMGINVTSAISVLMGTALNERRAIDGIQKFMEVYEAEKAKETA